MFLPNNYNIMRFTISSSFPFWPIALYYGKPYFSKIEKPKYETIIKADCYSLLKPTQPLNCKNMSD